MAADPGLWLHVYPCGIPFTGTVEYTGNNASYYYDKYYEFSSEEASSTDGSSGCTSVFGGEFGTGEDIRITITACGKEFSWDAKSVYGDNISLYLDVPEECLVRPTTTITVSLEGTSNTITVKSLKTGQEYTDIDTSDNSYFFINNVSVCEYIEITAVGHTPTRGFVTPSTKPFTDIELCFFVNKATDTLPSALYAWENPNVVSEIITYSAWVSDSSDAYSQVLYTLTQNPDGNSKLFYFDSNCNPIDVSDQLDSDYYIKDLSGAYYDRDPNYDIYINEGTDSIYYTTNEEINSGEVLYNSAGIDTGLRLGNIVSNGFELDTVKITFTPYTDAGAWSGSYEGTVNNISFVSADNGYNGCTPNTFLVTKGQPCTIKAEKTNKGYGMALKDSAGNQVAYGDLAFEYTFTPTEDCTFEIGANIEK